MKIVTLRVGARAKGGKGGGEGRGEENKLFSLLSPRPIFSFLSEFQYGAFASNVWRPKKTPVLQASYSLSN